jgi:formylglycine-generating enzyme required for sulfatase activity
MTFLGWQISFANIEELVKLRRHVSVISFDGTTIYSYPGKVTNEARQAHRASVYHAINNGLEIPEPVQREYPELFSSVPAVTDGCDLPIEMIAVSGGTFRMGDIFGDGYEDEKPVHDVTINSFYLSKYLVTQELWEAVMGYNPSKFKLGGAYPVEQVSWYDTQLFIEKLNAMTKGNYRLPSEAEWEYAARCGGREAKWSGIDNPRDLHRYAWFDQNAEGKTHPVGQKMSNTLGFYDMSGNVWEWCRDNYSADFYSRSEAENPVGPLAGDEKVLRGGSWRRSSEYLRTVERAYFRPDLRFRCVGFRLASSFRYVGQSELF